MLHSLKGKVLSVYIFLMLLIFLMAAVSIYNLYYLNKAIDGLIASNYRSIAAATNMIDAIERQDSNQLIYLEVNHEKGIRAFNENQKEFFTWLSKAKDNVTEDTEGQIIENISADYMKYIESYSELQEINNAEGSAEAVRFYDSKIYPIFYSIKDSCKKLLALNEEAMFNSKERATVNSKNQMYSTIILSVLSIIIGMAVSFYFIKKTINPIYMLISGVKSIKEGNLNQEINITAQDEIGELAAEFNDMTKRLLEYDRSSVKNLLAEKNKSLAIVKSISDPIIVINNDYKITLVNKSAETIFNISEKNVLGGHLLEAIGDKTIFQKVKSIIEGGKDVLNVNEPITILKDGKKYFFLLTVESILSDDNHVNGIVCVFKDVTHLKEVEQLKSDFISTVSHELRTPLTSIIMGTRLLLDNDREALTGDQKEIIEAIDEDGNQLMLLINDLLDLSKIESGKMQINLEKSSIFDIAELSIRPLAEIAESKGIKIINEIPPKLPPIYVDYKKVKCIFNNLITNAIKFTNKDGIIEISARVENSFMRVSVKDTGIGIPEEYHLKIFDKFTQVRDMHDINDVEGSGLGLAVAKEFVKKHNGNIWVESKPGEGSEFIFTLPLFKG